MDTLNKKLKAFRKSQGWTQEYIADRLGISQPAYQKLEAGDSDSMRVSTLRKICTEFNMSADELLGLKEQKELSAYEVALLAVKERQEHPVKGMKKRGSISTTKRKIAQPKKAIADE